MNQLIKAILAACAIASCSACQSADTPKAFVDSYLKTLSPEDNKASRQYLCWQGEAAKELPMQLPTGIKKWEFTGEQDKISEKDPDSRYKLVSVRIESASVGGFPITKTWTFEVWKSDEFYENSKRAIDRLNQVLSQGRKNLEDASKLLGDSSLAPTTTTELVSPPDRKAVASKPYCISEVDSFN